MVSIASVLLLALATAEAFAAAPPVTGTIACTVGAGTVTVRPRLATTPAAKAGKVKIRIDADDTSCDSSNAEGGKRSISAVAVKVTAKYAAGTACTDPATMPPLAGKVKVQFKGVGATGKLQTVAVNKTTIGEQFSGSSLRFGLLTPVQTEDAFAGEAVSIILNPQIVSGLCTDAFPLEGFTLIGSVATTDSACDANRIGDGRCDAGCNNLTFAYDGGDCCPGTCKAGGTYACGSSGYNCVGSF